MRRSTVAIVLVLAGCAARSAPPAAPPPTSAVAASTPAATCLADALGPLDGDIPTRACAPDGAGCAAACQQGDAASCWARAAQVQRDPATEGEANTLFDRACRLGLANGCTNVAASMWLTSKTADDYECARRVFEAACATGDHFACGMDGRLRVERGQGDDLTRGRAILESTCIAVGGFPCRILALHYESGRLGTSPTGRLEELMKMACDGGDLDACGDHATVAETFRP